MTHKAWLDNEYNLWVEALESSTVDNFKEHPQVKRMLGEAGHSEFHTKAVTVALEQHWKTVLTINNIGYSNFRPFISGTCLRMIYWALEVLKLKPDSICEIGAGVCEFYAVIRALGYKGQYFVYDLPEVKKFQRKYLDKVQELTGLELPIIETARGKILLVSFYALGEFDDELKQWYIDRIVNRYNYGFIVWNFHSGSSPEINITHKFTSVPCDKEDSIIVTW